MIEFWLGLPGVLIFAALFVFYAATAAAMSWVAFGSPWRVATQSLKGIVGPFFASVGILFALQTGFLGNEVATRNRLASQAVVAESAAVARVHALSVASASDMAGIRAALQGYVDAVVNDEWSRMSAQMRSERAEAAITGLLQEVSDPRVAADAGQAVHVALLNAVVQVGAARSDRLALASDSTGELKWLSVLVLGVITQLGIALVHLERVRAQVAALAVFSAGAIVVLSLIALQEVPFAGAVQVSPGPLLDTLKAISAAR
ncbi:bestrophin-like domain [Limobrevibacterium gyesilva]|uniref:DUF4239 domain-containing protein n=1 Tax=Limobrevibacterium gyesilva TaxID=2991712 RepID=A0AA41YMI5_9PROT|nr:DUF4239 domain-containing protein [Limobrevibacterium gyesilva]MCW3476639.1 DUF4239 domain-containing protein [Limobrevibacterium gyesilva]